MRIISGKYKGKLILEPPSEITRPMMQRVKDSVLNTLADVIRGAEVCDLFAGSGALGIECISRGAKSAVFVDRDAGVCEIVKKNLANCKIEAEVYNSDYLDALKRFKQIGKKFNLILVAPPYASDFGYKAIEYIVNNGLLAKNGQIMFETTLEGQEPLLIALGLSCRTKTYGHGKKVYFLEQQTN